MTQPQLTTKRLLLRRYEPADAAAVQRLAGDRAIADTTLNIPHPYEDGMAEAWIGQTHAQFAAGARATFAILSRDSDELLGTVSLGIDEAANAAVLGYWIGKPYWNRGYATEASERLVAWGFEALGLNRIHSSHLTRNPASGAVMRKIGLVHEGTAREAVLKWERYEDLELYALLRRDWQAPPGDA